VCRCSYESFKAAIEWGDLYSEHPSRPGYPSGCLNLLTHDSFIKWLAPGDHLIPRSWDYFHPSRSPSSPSHCGAPSSEPLSSAVFLFLPKPFAFS
jgi:hypothetical protein